MTRKEITWVKDVINYNHKMSLGALKNLIEDNERLLKTIPTYTISYP
jgi:hypothetical protein